MDSAALKEAEQIYPRLFPSGYSLLVIRHGYIVSESYFHGQTAETPNHVYSVTKTFVATLLGIAVQQGWIEGVHHRVADLLPEYSVHPKLAALTLEDVLTHRSGVRNFADVSLLLKEEPQSPPGTAFEYSNYAPNLLTAILDRLAKQGVAGAASDVPALAQEYLFGPLGIHVTEWTKGPHGVPEGGNGLHMTTRDMARLGYLLLREGRWEDKQLLPPGWVRAATERRVEFDREKGYGYLNWVRKRSDIVKTAQGNQNVQGYFAYGHRGQFIGVYPELDLLVVTTADATDATRDTFFVPDLLHDFVRRFVFPALIPSHSPPVEKK
ncbi:serine hydrolase domain-containing protein [Sneathiella sp.]|uniref:serine hydrolase domain-containing protein n=1 Tax=Sneathiella sp. TaxID=1964365 RepID=UPI0035666EBD